MSLFFSVTLTSLDLLTPFHAFAEVPWPTSGLAAPSNLIAGIPVDQRCLTSSVKEQAEHMHMETKLGITYMLTKEHGRSRGKKKTLLQNDSE